MIKRADEDEVNRLEDEAIGVMFRALVGLATHRGAGRIPYEVMRVRLDRIKKQVEDLGG